AASRALAVFVLADKYGSDPAAEDCRTLTAVLAVAQFVRQFGPSSGAGGSRGEGSWGRSRRGPRGRGDDEGYAEAEEGNEGSQDEEVEEEDEEARVEGWQSTHWRTRWNLLPPRRPPRIVAQFLLRTSPGSAVGLMGPPQHHLQLHHLHHLNLRHLHHHPTELGLLPLRTPPFPFCVGSLRAGLLGGCLHTPGLAALLGNLCVSARMRRGRLGGGQEDLSMLTDCGWLPEYLHGAATHIHEVTFPGPYWGRSFRAAALKLWREERVVLIGLRSPHAVQGAGGEEE
ncbi:hypothetical protein Agub_g10049, partial [Astrephomene gubernaculifera]